MKNFFKKISLLFFLGFRFLNINKKGKVNLIFFLLFLSISLGLLALIVVIGIMNGFQSNHISRRLEIGSFHAVIKKLDNKNFTITEALNLKQYLYENYKEIKTVIPFTEKETIMRTKGALYTSEQIIKLRAVDPDEINKDKKFLEYSQLAKKKINLKINSIILGEELFDRIDMRAGNEINLLGDISLSNYKKEGTPFIIEDIFKTGSYDYDRYWAFISIYAFSNLIGKNEVECIGVKFDNYQKSNHIIRKLKTEYASIYGIKSAEELNRGYFTALKIEKIMMLVLFYLIFLMISINTYGALKLKLIEKKSEVGILKAIGLSAHDVKILFLINSIVISSLGALFGNITGFFVVYNIINIFSFFEKIINFFIFYLSMIFEKINPALIFHEFKIYDETIYYQSSFPVKLDFPELLLINLIIILMTVFASYLPVVKFSKLKPIEAIKREQG